MTDAPGLGDVKLNCLCSLGLKLVGVRQEGTGCTSLCHRLAQQPLLGCALQIIP